MASPLDPPGLFLVRNGEVYRLKDDLQPAAQPAYRIGQYPTPGPVLSVLAGAGPVALGAIHAIAHPIDTLQGLVTLVTKTTNPKQLAQTAYDQVARGSTAGKWAAGGAGFANILAIFLSKKLAGKAGAMAPPVVTQVVPWGGNSLALAGVQVGAAPKVAAAGVTATGVAAIGDAHVQQMLGGRWNPFGSNTKQPPAKVAAGEPKAAKPEQTAAAKSPVAEKPVVQKPSPTQRDYYATPDLPEAPSRYADGVREAWEKTQEETFEWCQYAPATTRLRGTEDFGALERMLGARPLEARIEFSATDMLESIQTGGSGTRYFLERYGTLNMLRRVEYEAGQMTSESFTPMNQFENVFRGHIVTLLGYDNPLLRTFFGV